MAVHPRVLRRFIVIAFAATAVAFAGWGVVRHVTQAPPGEYGVRQGNILLSDGKYEKAIERFEAALEEAPRHPGAMMGRAIALLQGGRLQDARAAFDRLIGFLIEQVPAAEPNRPSLLATAFANRGILHDRAGRHEMALADYGKALAIDPHIVSGPELIDRVLYGMPDAASVARRADYLEAQLKLPPDKRQLVRPEADARQRMHRP